MHDVKLRHLAALHDDGAHSRNAVEGWLEIVGGNFPETRLGHGVRGETVAEDGKRGEGEAVGGDPDSGGEGLLDLAQRSVNELKLDDHVDVPVEEEADLGRSATGCGAHGHQAGNRVDGIFDGPGDHDFHLLDGHDTVVDADDDARKVGFREDGDGHLERQVNAGQGEDSSEEEDGASVVGQPEARLGESREMRRQH